MPRKLIEEKIEKIKESRAIFEAYYAKGFLGAEDLNKSEVWRTVKWPGTLGNFLKDVWGKWLREKREESKTINKEDDCNG